MNTRQASQYATRDAVMNLLSDVEVARVSTAESAPNLSDGDEYVDLERLDSGVQRARAVPTPMGRVLARNAVHETTRNKIVSTLSHQQP